MSYTREFRTALYSLDGIGSHWYWRIINYLTKHEIAEAEFWVNSSSIWQKISLTKKIEESIYKFKKDYSSCSYFANLTDKNIRVVFSDDQEYPSLLRQLDFHPPLLFVKGGRIKASQSLGVVGTRKITPYGQEVVRFLIPELAKMRTIVSGFMYGVDVAAQQAAMDSVGYTIGILGFGFDFMYPASQHRLFAEFLERGASFISPFAPHVAPRPGNFPARNVLVAGMTNGLCVIEAAKNSGSLLTAITAADLGKEVWAVPGSIFSPFSEGVQELLKQGANLARQPGDIVPELDSKAQIQLLVDNLSSHEQLVLDTLQIGKHSFDELITKTKLSLTELQTNLVNLQLKNLVEEHFLIW